MFIRAGLGDAGVDFGWKRGDVVSVKGDEEQVSYVLDAVYPTRLGPGHDQGSPIYLLGGHDTYWIHVDQPTPIVQEVCEVIVKGLGKGQPRDMLAALVHLADCWRCINALAALAQSMPVDPHWPSVTESFTLLRDRIMGNEAERLNERFQRPRRPPGAPANEGDP